MNLENTSLQAFLEDCEDGSGPYKSGLQWSLWWQIALENVEQGMPEVGEQIYTLVGGHCGNGANIRIIDKIDDEWIYLAHPDLNDIRSLVKKSRWYREIVRYNHTTNIDLAPHRDKFSRLIHYIAIGNV